MGVISRLRAAGSALIQKDAGAGAANVGGGGWLPTLGGSPSATGLIISQATAMAVSAIYACVTIRAQDVARCTPRVFHTKPKSGTREQIFEHDLVELFRNPNEQQTWFEFAEQTVAGYLLRGGGYALARRRNKRAEVSDLIPINPDAVQVLEGYNGGVFYNVNRVGLWQMAMLREFPPAINAEDMFHLKGLTFNALVALSTIHMARDAVGIAMGLEQQAARWMANGARPSTILESKKELSEPTAKRLKKQFDELKAGLANTGSTILLEDGITAKALTLTSSDLAFIEQRKFQVEDSCRFYRVPPFKLGATELRGIDIEEINNDYVSGTIMPDLVRIEQRFEKTFDLPRQNLSVDFDERALLRSATKVRFANNRIGLGGASFLTVNEVRAGEQLPPVDGGDVLYQPSNLAALGSDKTGGAPDGAGRPADGDLPMPTVPVKPVAGADDGEKGMVFSLPPINVQAEKIGEQEPMVAS
jgi:HK97 family phage portal protein